MMNPLLINNIVLLREMLPSTRRFNAARVALRIAVFLSLRVELQISRAFAASIAAHFIVVAPVQDCRSDKLRTLV